MMTETEHLLVCLAEECAEVQQRVTKALRFGLDEVEPGQALSNATRILIETIDLRAVLGMCQQRRILPLPSADEWDRLGAAKCRKVEKFMEYAREQGTLERK